MADVKRNLLARGAALAALVLVLLSTSITFASERAGTPSSYYLTVKLVESHLPDDAKKRRHVLGKVFSGKHTTATLQIELDIGGQTSRAPFNSTTVADAIGVKAALSSEKRKKYKLRDHVIVSNHRIYRKDIVALGFTYSAMFHSINALDRAKKIFQLENHTYLGLASQALRVFTRETDTLVFDGTSYTAKEISQRAATDDDGLNTYCVILTPHDTIPSCEEVGPDTNFPYVKLNLEVSYSIFTTSEEDLLDDLQGYMKDYHGDLHERILQPGTTSEELDQHCVELQRALDLDLVPGDRDLVLLGLLKEIKFDPEAKITNRCWSDRRAVLESLSRRHQTLNLEACAALKSVQSREECRLVTKFMRHWLMGTYVGSEFDGNEIDWSVTYPRRDREQNGGLDNLLSLYRLELRYGNFERQKGVWTAAGSIYDVKRKCLFEAEVRFSIVGEDSSPTVRGVQIYHDKDAKVGKPPTSIKESKAWRSVTECPVLWPEEAVPSHRLTGVRRKGD